MARGWRWLRRRDGLLQVAIVAGGFEVYEAARRFIHPDWDAAFANAAKVEQLERWGHFAWEQSLQKVVLEVPEVIQFLNAFYFVGHFIFTGVFFTWLYFRSRAGFRSFRNAFLIATAISLVIHWKFPTAPPRLADVGLTDTLRAFSGIDIGSPQSAPFSNPVAAVPSLHAGFAVGVMWGLWKFAPRAWIRALAVLYFLAVVWTIVVTGNHFLVDAAAGVLVMAVGFGLAARLPSTRNRAILVSTPRGGAVR